MSNKSNNNNKNNRRSYCSREWQALGYPLLEDSLECDLFPLHFDVVSAFVRIMLVSNHHTNNTTTTTHKNHSTHNHDTQHHRISEDEVEECVMRAKEEFALEETSMRHKLQLIQNCIIVVHNNNNNNNNNKNDSMNHEDESLEKMMEIGIAAEEYFRKEALRFCTILTREWKEEHLRAFVLAHKQSIIHVNTSIKHTTHTNNSSDSRGEVLQALVKLLFHASHAMYAWLDTAKNISTIACTTNSSSDCPDHDDNNTHSNCQEESVIGMMQVFHTLFGGLSADNRRRAILRFGGFESYSLLPNALSIHALRNKRLRLSSSTTMVCSKQQGQEQEQDHSRNNLDESSSSWLEYFTQQVNRKNKTTKENGSDKNSKNTIGNENTCLTVSCKIPQRFLDSAKLSIHNMNLAANNHNNKKKVNHKRNRITNKGRDRANSNISLRSSSTSYSVSSSSVTSPSITSTAIGNITDVDDHENASRTEKVLPVRKKTKLLQRPRSRSNSSLTSVDSAASCMHETAIAFGTAVSRAIRGNITHHTLNIKKIQPSSSWGITLTKSDNTGMALVHRVSSLNKNEIRSTGDSSYLKEGDIIIGLRGIHTSSTMPHINDNDGRNDINASVSSPVTSVATKGKVFGVHSILEFQDCVRMFKINDELKVTVLRAQSVTHVDS